MSLQKEAATTTIPLFGICDPARHHLRPVIMGTTKREGGHEEFEILMVCSRCGYTRNARQLQQVSEQLALEVLEEIAQTSGEDGSTDASKEPSDGTSADGNDNGNATPVGNPKRKKVN